MRVISGKAKHMPLKSIQGMQTRPTTDRIKETLFNMIQNEIYGCRFLDLFAGSGAIGIEALSRGAECAVFVEKNPQAVRCIRENLSFTKLEQDARILSTDVIAAFNSLEKERFDIIFMDPPYDQGLEQKVLEMLSENGMADTETLIITEASLQTEFDYLERLGFEIQKHKKYKTNAHIFIRKSEENR